MPAATATIPALTVEDVPRQTGPSLSEMAADPDLCDATRERILSATGKPVPVAAFNSSI